MLRLLLTLEDSTGSFADIHADGLMLEQGTLRLKHLPLPRLRVPLMYMNYVSPR